MKKRFLLFEYYEYYPCGGINDLKKTFDTISYEIDEKYIEIINNRVLHFGIQGNEAKS